MIRIGRTHTRLESEDGETLCRFGNVLVLDTRREGVTIAAVGNSDDWEPDQLPLPAHLVQIDLVAAALEKHEHAATLWEGFVRFFITAGRFKRPVPFRTRLKHLFVNPVIEVRVAIGDVNARAAVCAAIENAGSRHVLRVTGTDGD
jgi:hypothetical protein